MVLSFTTGSVETPRRIVEATSMFRICVSFGSIYSTISVSGCMSHASVPPEVGELRELPADLVRISVGIEDAGDLIADVEQAFATLASPAEIAPEEDATEVVSESGVSRLRNRQLGEYHNVGLAFFTSALRNSGGYAMYRTGSCRIVPNHTIQDRVR